MAFSGDTLEPEDEDGDENIGEMLTEFFDPTVGDDDIGATLAAMNLEDMDAIMMEQILSIKYSIDKLWERLTNPPPFSNLMLLLTSGSSLSTSSSIRAFLGNSYIELSIWLITGFSFAISVAKSFSGSQVMYDQQRSITRHVYRRRS